MVYVIAGANGAGKTTFASKFLPEFVKCRNFLNADLIAAGLSPFAPQEENVRAGRLLLQRINELAAARKDFGFETTLSGRTYVRMLGNMKRNGYRIALFFLWLPSPELALARVANRVRQGGHPVPEEDVRRRYSAGLRNLFRLYRPIVDAWWIYDASQFPPKLIARQERSKLVCHDRNYITRSRSRRREKGMSKANNASLSKLADAAFEQAMAHVIEQAKQSGTPVILWENGRVKAVPCAKLRPRNARKIGKNETK